MICPQCEAENVFTAARCVRCGKPFGPPRQNLVGQGSRTEEGDGPSQPSNWFAQYALWSRPITYLGLLAAAALGCGAWVTISSALFIIPSKLINWTGTAVFLWPFLGIPAAGFLGFIGGLKTFYTYFQIFCSLSSDQAKSHEEVVLASLMTHIGVIILGIAGIVGLGLLFVYAIPPYTFYTPKDFVAACRDNRVRFYRTPNGPVTTILIEEKLANPTDQSLQGYVIKDKKRLSGKGVAWEGWQPEISNVVQVYRAIPLHKIKSSQTSIPKQKYWRFFRDQHELKDAPLEFEISVLHHTENLTLDSNDVAQKKSMVRHSVTVIERHSQEKIAEMTFILDKERHLACGENLPRQINPDVFILQATNLIGSVVPPPAIANSWARPLTSYVP